MQTIRKFKDLETGKESRVKVQENGLLREVRTSKFIPKIKERFYIVNQFGYVNCVHLNNEEELNFYLKNGGLCFETYDKAQEYLDYLHILHKYTYEFSEEEWNDSCIYKYYIYYNYGGNKLRYNGCDCSYKKQHYYFKSKDDAKQFVKEVGEDHVKRFMFDIWE